MFASDFRTYRPPTPQYVPFGIWRFRAFLSHDVWQVVFSHPFEKHRFYPIVRFRSIVWIKSSFRTSDYKETRKIAAFYYCTSRLNPSPVSIRALGTMASANFSWQTLLHTFHKKTIHHVRETSSDKGINFPAYVRSIYTNRSG